MKKLQHGRNDSTNTKCLFGGCHFRRNFGCVMRGVTLSHQPLDEILVQMHHATPIPQHNFWIPNSTQITKLYHKEELVEKGRSYIRGKGQQNSVPYTEFCMGGGKVVKETSYANRAQLVSILPGICPQLRTRIFHFVLS